jgi:hypothetical protein
VAASDGPTFIATHTYHSVLCLHPDGRREDIAAHSVLSPRGEVGPARLLRIDALQKTTA